MNTADTLAPDLLYKMDAYWRAANYVSVGQIYLYDNPMLREPLTLAHVKPLVVGHWGTVPGQNFIYVHLNRVIKKYDLNMFYIAGPGHGGAALVGNVYLEGTWSEVYPDVTQDEAGLKKLFKQFSFPGGISSHVAPTTPGSINEGGELGYSLSHAFGAVFDNPGLIVACVVGDGEAETGPLATAWQSNKLLNPVADGAVLPILHLNGFKISNPTVLARIEHEELDQFFRGCGWTPIFVEGDDPVSMHQAMAAAMERAVESIRQIQDDARHRNIAVRPRWPMIVLRSPKGWTGPEGGRRSAHRGNLPFAPGASDRGFAVPGACQAARDLDEELSGRRTVRPRRTLAARAGGAGAQRRAPHGGQSERQWRPAVAGVATARLSGARGARAIARGASAPGHARPRKLPCATSSSSIATSATSACSARTRRSRTCWGPSSKPPIVNGTRPLPRTTNSSRRRARCSTRCSASTSVKAGWKAICSPGGTDSSTATRPSSASSIRCSANTRSG